jgi:hypothetical protein
VTPCPACGEDNPPAARFCARCGARVAAATALATPVTPPVPQPTEQAPAVLAATRIPPPADGPAAAPHPVRGRLVAGAAVLLLVVAVVAAIARSVLPGDVARPLALPPPGEVAAAFVEGEPVFVVHDDDGDVRVLDAVVSYSADQPTVLAYCADSGTFEDLNNGSRFSRQGDLVSGPGPTGMAAYEIVERGDEQVVIGQRGDPPAREDADLDGVVIDPGCIARLNGWLDGEPDPRAADDLVLHEGPVSEDDVRRYPVTGITELLEELARPGDPDTS